MFDISFTELVVIGLVALIILGPQRLPEVARTAGKWAGQARRFMSAVKSDFERELNTPELEEFRKLQQELAETRTLIEAPADSLIEEPAKKSTTTDAASNDVSPAATVEPARLPEPAEAPKSAEAAPESAATPAADESVKPRTRRAATAKTKPATARKKHGGTAKRTTE